MDLSIFGSLTNKCQHVYTRKPSQQNNISTFQRNEPNEINYQKAKTHLQRKATLRQGRLHVLRILLRCFLKNHQCRQMVNYKGNSEINYNSVEIYLDDELINFDYDLEAMIEMYRVYTREPTVVDNVCYCGYVPPFCSCPI